MIFNIIRCIFIYWVVFLKQYYSKRVSYIMALRRLELLRKQTRRLVSFIVDVHKFSSIFIFYIFNQGNFISKTILFMKIFTFFFEFLPLLVVSPVKLGFYQESFGVVLIFWIYIYIFWGGAEFKSEVFHQNFVTQHVENAKKGENFHFSAVCHL